MGSWGICRAFYVVLFLFGWVEIQTGERKSLFEIDSKWRGKRNDRSVNIFLENYLIFFWFSITTNGLLENISRVQRFNVREELNDIPGGIGGHGDTDQEDDTLLPKTGREMGVVIL